MVPASNEPLSPTRAEIFYAQLQAAKDLYPASPELENLAKKINADMGNQFIAAESDGHYILETLQQIEETLGMWSPTGPNLYSAGRIKTSIAEEYEQTGSVDLVKYRNLLTNLQNLIGKIHVKWYHIVKSNSIH